MSNTTAEQTRKYANFLRCHSTTPGECSRKGKSCETCELNEPELRRRYMHEGPANLFREAGELLASYASNTNTG